MVKDLGIIFDEHLTFKEHVAATANRAYMACGTAIRFGKEIRTNTLIVTTVNTYISPICEYGSVIWDCVDATTLRGLDLPLRTATRKKLRSPYRNTTPGYLTFEQRLKRMGLLSYGQRRKIAQVILIRKIETEQLQIENAEGIARNARTGNYPRGGRNVYDVQRSSFSHKGPIGRAMRTANELSRFCSDDDSISAIRCKLKRHFLNEFPEISRALR